MMTKREKLYFLIDHIEEARAITPSGQPILVDPTNDLNRKISEVELKQLFTKLEKDEKILKVLQVPSGISRVEIVEDPDPYDPPYQQDDGCWHIELLPAFDSYFSKIRLEPEYQEFTGYKPASQIRPSINDLMTYEEKLDLIVRAVVEARKATRKGQTTTLYLNTSNGLDRLDRKEIRNILLQLQDENALKLNTKTNRLLPLSQQPTNPTYFLLDIIDGFDGWFENYLMKQKTELTNLDFINMLRIYDVVLDINEQVQLTNKTTVTIHLLPPLVRFSILFPADSVRFRDKYCETRWDSLKYLREKSIIDDFKHNEGLHRWQTTVSISLKLSKFDDFYKKIKDEYVKRNKSNKKSEKSKTTPLKIDPKKVSARVSYDPKKGELDIEGKGVKFKKDSFRAKLLELLLKDDKSRKKEWSWDEVIDEIQGTGDSPSLRKENKKKFYPACDGLTKHIASKTGVNDLLIFNKSTVQITPKYL